MGEEGPFTGSVPREGVRVSDMWETLFKTARGTQVSAFVKSWKHPRS